MSWSESADIPITSPFARLGCDCSNARKRPVASMPPMICDTHEHSVLKYTRIHSSEVTMDYYINSVSSNYPHKSEMCTRAIYCTGICMSMRTTSNEPSAEAAAASKQTKASTPFSATATQYEALSSPRLKSFMTCWD